MTSSRIFIYLCFAFLGGVAMNSLVLIPQGFMLATSVLGIAFAVVFYKKDKRLVVVGLCLIMLALGIFRHQMFDRPQDNFDYYKASQNLSQTDKIQNSPISSAPRFISQGIFAFKDELRESIDSSLSPPHSSILGAMMLGETERLSFELKEKLNRSGTRHITAISGMHVVILANMFIGLGLLLGLWRGQAFYFALAAIIFFVVMVGSPPSAIRALTMGSIVLFAEKVGRLSQAQRLLVIAATIMLAFNPLLLRFDVGFQLSFLATLGIAKLSPYLRKKLTRVPKFFEIRNTISMTIPAVIFTAPILASNFGQLSLVSVLTNILVVPIISLVLGFGFFAGIFGIIFPPLGPIMFAPVWLFLSYVYLVIDLSAKFTFAVIEIEAVPWYLTALYFALLWWGVKRL